MKKVRINSDLKKLAELTEHLQKFLDVIRSCDCEICKFSETCKLTVMDILPETKCPNYKKLKIF